MYALRQIVLVLLLGLAPLTGALAQDVVGSITDGSGEIIVTRSGNAQAAGVGTEIWQYDEVYVGGDGEATITFVDNTVLALSGGSAMTIDEFVYDPSSQANSGLFTLAGGVIGLVSGDMLKTGDMMVTTPVSTIGIRGTAVLIDSGTIVTVDGQGNYVLTASGTGGETISLVVSPDGTIGVVNVVNNETGQTTTLSRFGDTVVTQVVNGSSIQSTSKATTDQIRRKFNRVLLALQNATGKDLGDSANVAEKEELEEALKELFEETEEEASND